MAIHFNALEQAVLFLLGIAHKHIPQFDMRTWPQRTPMAIVIKNE